MELVFLQAKSPDMSMMIMLIGIPIVFYFFMIRPQQKKQKEAKKFRESLSKGEEVITAGGIHGKIVAVDGEVVVLDVDRGTKLTIEKSSLISSK